MQMGIKSVSLWAMVGAALCAQTLPPQPVYTYDVVSIHKSDPAERNIRVTEGPQGGLRTINTSVLHLIAAAYKVEEYRIFGAPKWADSEHFDVMFTPDKAETTPAADAMAKEWDGFFSHNLQRLQAVLRDRFGLVVRTETREMPIYLLTQAKGRRPGLRASRMANPEDRSLKTATGKSKAQMPPCRCWRTNWPGN